MAPDVSAIFDELDGPANVARLLNAPVTTVWAWKKNGRIPPSRLAHLRLAAKASGLVAPSLHASEDIIPNSSATADASIPQNSEAA